MPRQAKASGQNKFIRGLITETTALSFPADACTETFNCVFDETGKVSRRLGIDAELDYELLSITPESDEVYTEYLWKAVAGDGSRTFLVQQQGDTLRFFQIVGDTQVSSNNTSLTIDLNARLASGSPSNPAQLECQYASGLGRLIVVNPACDPFFITYSPSENTLTVVEIDIKVRDFLGVDDGLELNERPTGTINDLQTTNPEHWYNIQNQGWYIADAITQWQTARSDMPSNADKVPLYRASETDAFDNARVLANSPGNSPAVGGHFLLTAWNPDRNQAMVDEGVEGAAVLADGTVQIGDSVAITGTIGNFADATRAFDGETSEIATNSATAVQANSWIGKDWGLDGPFIITSVTAYGSNDQGFIHSANPSISLQLYGKQGDPPANGTDGTLLGTTSFTDTSNESAGRVISSSDTATFWNHSWVRVVEGTPSQLMAELRFFTVDPVSEDQLYRVERPSTVEFFAGRAWYAGINAQGLSTNIYFSQIVESTDQFGKCYQQNDSTSEDFSDLLPTDGGVINIPEIASVKKLFSYQNSILVFATNGVWQISGGTNGGFLATDYVVKRLSSTGTQSPMSFTSNKGIPVWWGESGIYSVKFDPNYGSFSVENVSDNTIKSFVLGIPELNRRYVKAAYDTTNDTLYFLYNDTEELDSSNYYTYNKVLCANSISGAFYPWTISETGPKVKGIVYIIDSTGESSSAIKLAIHINQGGSDYLTYAEARNSNYKDWGFLSLEEGEDYEEDYSSYFISGYAIEGGAQRFFQSNYIWLYLLQEDCAGAFVQGLWDFTNSGDSGKWSTPQQAYNNCLINRAVNHRRLKIRGKGKALQIKVYSESGKPFTMLGWSVWETINANI